MKPSRPDIVISPMQVVALNPGNQTRLGSGCVCDSGCESCARLAEAWEAMWWALRRVSESALIDIDRYPDIAKEARAALRLAEGVKR